MSNTILNTLSEEMIPAVEAEMRLVLEVEQSASDRFWGMMHYHMGWAEASLEPANHKSGKRIRPLICLLACMASGGDWRQAVPAGAAIELLHNFTLIHDDIQDNSPTRRGRPTLWKIWGLEQAINSGDAMFALSHMAMARLIELDIPAPIVVQALRRLDETCLELTNGQYNDMRFEQEESVTVEEYLEMINGKTAALLSLSTELGALIAGKDEETVAHYAAFGRELGLAFQVRDDILGIWGDESLIGKSAATDIETRKKSLPVLYGLEKSDALRQLYGRSENGDGFVEEAIGLLDEVGAQQFTHKHEKAYSRSALDHLEAVNPQGEGAEAIHQLVALLLNRES
ncbi:MAG: polyprenyl synthetase family protein [Candidatus Promineifilaceae bacterium]